MQMPDTLRNRYTTIGDQDSFQYLVSGWWVSKSSSRGPRDVSASATRKLYNVKMNCLLFSSFDIASFDITTHKICTLESDQVFK